MAATRTSFKNQINKVLSEVTKGLHKDDCWKPVYAAFDAIRALGFELTHTGNRYGQDDKGNPIYKVWTYEITFGNKPLYGVLTAHGAGTVSDPLCAYDISAYCS